MSQAKHRYLCLAAWLVLLTTSYPIATAQTTDANSGVLSFGAARLTYDPATWTAEQDDEPGKWKLTHTKGDAWGQFIAQRLQVPESTLVDFATENIRKKVSRVKVLSQDTRAIAGGTVRVVRFSGEWRGTPVSGQGCYYGGKLGAVQVGMWTGAQLLDEYQSDFDQLCDGLEMGQQHAPGTVQNVSPDDKSATDGKASAKSQAAPATPPPPAIFILTNGERLESSRYTMTANSVRVQQGETERTIPISALNLQATNAANHARGLELQIPTSKNQMILSF